MDMKVGVAPYDGGVHVTLSRRNLVELLAELDNIAHRKEVDGLPLYEPSLHRMTANGYLVVEAQEDDEHYQDRTPGTLGMVVR